MQKAGQFRRLRSAKVTLFLLHTGPLTLMLALFVVIILLLDKVHSYILA